MLSITVTCPKCSTKYEIHKSYIGNEVECQICHTNFIIRSTPILSIPIEKQNNNVYIILENTDRNFIINQMIGDIDITKLVNKIFKIENSICRIVSIIETNAGKTLLCNVLVGEKAGKQKGFVTYHTNFNDILLNKQNVHLIEVPLPRKSWWNLF
jgi:hypothetical protein